jgi:hypothetical protein
VLPFPLIHPLLLAPLANLLLTIGYITPRAD